MRPSSIVPLPEFDLWGVPGTQITVDRIIDAEYYPLANTDSKIVNFKIKTNPDEYIKLDELMLAWTAQWTLSKTDKNAAFSGSDFSGSNLVAYAMHSMIKEVFITINNKQISKLPQCYSYRAFIEAFLGYSKHAKKTILSTAFWDESFKTSLTQLEDKSPKTIKYNMRGKLHSDLSFQGRYLLGGCTIGIEIHMHDPNFYFKLNPNLSNASLDLTNVKLLVKKAKVNHSIVDAHRKALQISPAKYPIARTEIKHLNIPSGLSDVWLDNFIFGQLPRRMFLFLVKNESFKGNYNSDPFQLSDYKLSYLCSFIDGIAYPNVPFTPNFEKLDYNREYLSVYDALNQTGSDVNLYLEKSVYKGSKVIFGFNYAKDLSNGNAGLEGHINPPTEGTLRIQLKFDQPLQDPIVAIAFCEFDDTLLIDKLGQVSFENV